MRHLRQVLQIAAVGMPGQDLESSHGSLRENGRDSEWPRPGAGRRPARGAGRSLLESAWSFSLLVNMPRSPAWSWRLRCCGNPDDCRRLLRDDESGSIADERSSSCSGAGLEFASSIDAAWCGKGERGACPDCISLDNASDSGRNSCLSIVGRVLHAILMRSPVSDYWFGHDRTPAASGRGQGPGFFLLLRVSVRRVQRCR